MTRPKVIVAKRIGRPSHLYDEARIDRVVKLIRVGVFPEVAAAANAIHRGTYYRWIQDAGHADRKVEEGLDLTEYERRERDFRDRIEEAEGYAEARMTAEARTQARRQGGAQGTVQLLERRFAARWRPTSQTELVGPGGGPVQFADLTDEELEGRLRKLTDIAQEVTR